MSLNADQLFALLPAVYRNRDGELGGPLQALFAVLAGQVGIVEDNIQQLIRRPVHRNLRALGHPLHRRSHRLQLHLRDGAGCFDSRAEVANTIGYRRRKGTLLALEQIASDVSGRPALAVEEFRRLITTESMRLVRPRHATTVDLRHNCALDRLGTAFDPASRTIDVRRIAPRLRSLPTLTPLRWTSPSRPRPLQHPRHRHPSVAMEEREVTNAPAFPWATDATSSARSAQTCRSSRSLPHALHSADSRPHRCAAAHRPHRVRSQPREPSAAQFYGPPPACC